MTIIAIEGVRGTGKTTLWNKLGVKYPEQMTFWKFPTHVVKTCLKDHKYDMSKIDDVISYNMLFIEDFISSIESFYENSDEIIVIDRYILSNLAHFKYDIYNTEHTSAYEWQGISRILYYMFDNHLVLKPDLIIYLQGEHKQPESKFDDSLYKGKEEQLKWFYDTELANLKNKLNIPFTNVESLKPNTFEMVDSIVKRYI